MSTYFTFFPEADEDHEPSYDPSIAEDVFIQMDDGNVSYCCVMEHPSGKVGLTSCERDNGCLDYILSERYRLPRFGCVVIPSVSVHYIRGDGWTMDDDVAAEGGEIRPATRAEMFAYLGRSEVEPQYPAKLRLMLSMKRMRRALLGRKPRRWGPPRARFPLPLGINRSTLPPRKD